jgi:hypothetical protein
MTRSPWRLRRALAFCFDVLAHAGVGGALYLATGHPVPAAGTWLAASFVDRVPVQWACRATIGKAVFGLRVIRPLDGGRPTFGWFLAQWFTGLIPIALFALALLDGSGADVPSPAEMGFPPVVRRDVRGRP